MSPADRSSRKSRSPAGKALERWLADHPPAPEPGRDEPPGGAGAREDLRRMRPQAELDLHGLRAEEAERALERFLSASRRAGLRKVLIIHGKGHHSSGEPVLRKVAQRILERSPHAGAFGAAGREQGGSGALWVLLREAKRPR